MALVFDRAVQWDSAYDGRAQGAMIPANQSDHSDLSKHPYRSHVIYSDDHGATWKLGGIEDEKTNESALVELSAGDAGDEPGRFGLPGELLRLRDGEILFANPWSKRREDLTVQISDNGGKTFDRWMTAPSL